jgi:hypothetical protein
VKTSLVAGLTGALSVSVAWAGVGLVPVPSQPDGAVEQVPAPLAGQAAPAAQPATAGATTAALPALSGGELLVGAAKTDLTPRPQDMQAEFPGARWEQDLATCKILDPGFVEQLASNTQEHLDHLAVAGSPWPENPNCLYMGGYGLGPMNPITSFDEKLGLWVRALAVGDGKDLAVVTVIDGEGWLWDYANKCDDCGTKQIGEALAAEPELAARGFRPESFNLHATHSHTSMDFIGGWGFVPDWYMAQVTESIKQTVRDAVLSAEPAVLEVGTVDARRHNSERRGTYRSAEEAELTWLRAVVPGRPAARKKDEDVPARVIATLGAFAAHPVTQDESKGVAHPDWPGWFEKAAETRFGGVGLLVQTGLGNVTGARGRKTDEAGQTTPSTGDALAAMIPGVGEGTPVKTPDVRVAGTTWRQPVTNAPLDALGTPGFFDRQFDLQPATLTTGKNPDKAPCTSTAPQSVELPARAIKIGDEVVLTTGPGELFSNATNTIKEKSPDQVVFPFAQTNDALGYMPQSFELNPVGQQGLGFAAGGYAFVNYEDSYAVDRCVGDAALETILKLVRELQ